MNQMIVNVSGGRPALAAAAPDSGQFWALAGVMLIMLVAGLLGGYAAWLTEEREAASLAQDGRPVQPGEEPPLRKRRYLVLGIVATACVPLFLSLVDSNVLEEVLHNARDERLQSALVFTGLCLIAAFSARSFIQSVSQRVLQQVSAKADQAISTSLHAESIANASMDTSLDAIEEAAARSSPGAADELPHSGTGVTLEMPLQPLNEDERRILIALQDRSYRTLSGITAETGIPRERAAGLLADLSRQGLAHEAPSPNSGRTRWTISRLGLDALTQH